jgi:hypothetical protein
MDPWPSRVVGTLLLLAAAAVQAQDATLTARQTNVFGNFLVGTGPVGDSGSFSEFLTTLSSAYGQAADDAGAVNNVFNGMPVTGSASFASEAAFVFDPLQIVGNGAVATSGETPYSYVSLGANAASSVRLTFNLPVQTLVTLSGSVTRLLGPNVGTRLSSASASVTMNGLGSWSTTSHEGGFFASRTLLPGSYEIRGSASSSINGEASFVFNALLTPVPEPSGWLMLMSGALWVAHRRLRGRG